MSKILKKRFVILSLFFAVEIAGQTSVQHDQLKVSHSLRHLDCKSCRNYPVSLSKDQVRCIVVPAGNE